jgi:hypothetical protein
VRLVVLSVRHPIEDLLGEDVVAQAGHLGADLVEQRAGEEDWGQVSGELAAERDGGARRGAGMVVRLAMRCRLTSSWNWFLMTGSGWKKPVLELDGSMVEGERESACVVVDGVSFEVGDQESSRARGRNPSLQYLRREWR